MAKSKTITICGAGVAGIATAYYLKKALPSATINIIDKQQPLAYTSSKSGENFRDYWPHPAMEAFSSHSIDLMQELKKEHGEDAFILNFSGYHFVSQHPNKAIFADDLTADFKKKNDVVTDATTIQEKHPYLASTIKKSVFIRKAGHVDSITMSNLLLNLAKKEGLQLIEGEITNIEEKKGGFDIILADNQVITTDQVVIAAGPFINHLAGMLAIKFPIWNTLQRKFIIPDPKGIIPQDMPFTIFADGQYLDWSSEEIAFFKTEESLKWMTEAFPGAIHIKPESGRIKMGWAISKEPVNPLWDIPIAPYFPQVVLKGATRFIPALADYAENIPTPIIEYGGYYTRTKENWPLIGPSAKENVFVVGALAGFGSMTACAAGELCAAHITGNSLPSYAPYFHPNRYNNPVIQHEIDNLDMDGQL